MKRQGNIYIKICNKENIRCAILKASIGKKNKRSVIKILNNINFYVEEIYAMLINKEIKLTPYKEMIIHDGNRKKERTIYKPAFYPDQCLHWALMLQIQSIIEKGMYPYCCASVPNRGIQYAGKYIKKLLVRDKKNSKYFLQLDIKKFYPNIDKQIMKKKFRGIIKDADTINLIDTIIDSSKQGLPIGNYTSQWFANFYLQDLDHFIKEELKVPYYIRYMDDMLLFHRNKKELHKIKDKIEMFLKKENLKLKENWQLSKVDSRPIDFLGYRFYRGYTTLRRGNFLRIKRRIKKIYKRGNIRLIDAQAAISYNGWLKHSNCFNYKNKYIYPYINIEKCKGVVKNASKLSNRIKYSTKKI